MYHFDECSGTIVGDSSFYNNTGTLFNGTWTSDTAPITGSTGAIEFTNKTYIKIPDSTSLNPNNSITIEFWVNLNSVGFISNDVIVGKTPPGKTGYLANIANGKPQFSLNNQGLVSNLVANKTLNASTWHHVAFMWPSDPRATSFAIYIDGERVATGGGAWMINASNSGVYIGRRHPDQLVSAFFLIGKLDEVRISNIARYVKLLRFKVTQAVEDINLTVGKNTNVRADFKSYPGDSVAIRAYLNDSLIANNVCTTNAEGLGAVGMVFIPYINGDNLQLRVEAESNITGLKATEVLSRRVNIVGKSNRDRKLKDGICS